MFKTDETVRFGQILSARTLRYGKFNEYIIIILSYLFNGMGLVYIFLLFIFKCLLRSRSCLVCRSREDSKEEHSHQMQCSNPWWYSGHGGHGGGSCPTFGVSKYHPSSFGAFIGIESKDSIFLKNGHWFEHILSVYLSEKMLATIIAIYIPKSQ